MLRQKLLIYTKIYTKPPIYIWHIGMICLLCMVPIANAQIYKWVDKDGTVHYSQEKPSAEVASHDVITIKKSPQFDNTKALEALRTQQKEHAELRDARIEAKTAAKKQKEVAKARQELCQQSKARLADYSYPRINIEDADGNVTRLTEEKRQEEIARSQESIKEHCG